MLIHSHKRVCTKHLKNDVTYKSDDCVAGKIYIAVVFGLFVVECAFVVSL